MTTLKIENNESIVKHVESAAILAADHEAYRKHMLRRKSQLNLEQKVIMLEKRIEQLERIIQQINN